MNTAHADKKLREAQFFLARLEEQSRSITHDEAFDFYLSAFLAAARSVEDALRHEQPAAFTAWYPGWRAALTADEQEVLDYCRRQRNNEIHEGAAQVQRGTKFVPVSHLPLEPGRHPRYHPAAFWSAPPGVEPPSIGLRADTFDVEGVAVCVCTVCRRCLDLQMRLVADFKVANP